MTTRRRWTVMAAGVVATTVAVPAYAYFALDDQVSVPLAVARLGIPDLTVEPDGADVVVSPVAPSDGPSPTEYSVARLDTGGHPVVVCAHLAPTGTCRVTEPDPSSTYRVTAHLGTHWASDSDPLGLPPAGARRLAPPRPEEPAPDATNSPTAVPTGSAGESPSPTPAASDLPSPGADAGARADSPTPETGSPTP